MLDGLVIFTIALIFIVGVGAIGAIIYSLSRTRNQQIHLDFLDSGLSSTPKTFSGHIGRQELDLYLQSISVPVESYAGDLVAAVSASAASGVSAQGSELSGFILRRELGNPRIRFAKGVRASLLLLGILGTLFSIKPVLKNFGLAVDADGRSPTTEEAGEQVSSMVKGLGQAFNPSLWALSMTILLSLVLGYYLSIVSRMTLQVERMALTSLRRVFPVKTVSSELSRAAGLLSNLALRLDERSSQSEGVEDRLEAVALSISKVGEEYATLGEDQRKIVRYLKLNLDHFVEDLGSHFGKDSNLYQLTEKLAGFGGEMDEKIEKMSNLAQAASDERLHMLAGLKSEIGRQLKFAKEAREEFNDEGTKLAKRLEQSVDQKIENLLGVIKEATGKLKEEHSKVGESAKEAGRLVVEDLQSSFAHIGEMLSRSSNQSSVIVSRGEELVENIETISSGMDQSRNRMDQSRIQQDQKSVEYFDYIAAITAQIKAELDGIKVMQSASSNQPGDPTKSEVGALEPVPKQTMKVKLKNLLKIK